MPRVPVTSSVSKSRGGRISTAPLGMAQQGVARSAATSIIPFMNRDNSMSKIGQGLSAASSVIGGIAADKKNIENSVKDAAEAKAEAASKKMQDEFEKQQYINDTRTAKELAHQYRVFLRDQATSSGKMQGKDAIEGYDKFTAADETFRQNLLKNSSQDVVDKFDNFTWNSRNTASDKIYYHSDNEKVKYDNMLIAREADDLLDLTYDNIGNPKRFDAIKDDYKLNIASLLAQKGLPTNEFDAQLQEAMTKLHGLNIDKLISDERIMDAKTYLEANKDEFTNEGFDKAKDLINPLVLDLNSKNKAVEIIEKSKGNYFSQVKALRTIKDPELYKKTKEYIDKFNKEQADNKKALITAARDEYLDKGFVSMETAEMLDESVLRQATEQANELKKNSIQNQNAIEKGTITKADQFVQNWMMDKSDEEKIAINAWEFSQKNILGTEHYTQICNEQIAAKKRLDAETEKRGGKSKTEYLIETTSPDLKSALDIVITNNGIAKGTVPFEDIKLRLIEHINAEGITKPSEAIKEANRLMLFAERGSVDTSYDDYAAYASMPALGAIYNSAKNIYKYFSSNDEEKVRLIDLDRSDLRERPLAENDAMWHDGWGEKASNLEWDAQSGGWIQWSKNLFYDAISGEQMRLVPSEPAERPDGLPSDAQWNMVPDCPTYGWYWSPSKQQGYNAKGFMVIKENYE